MLHRRKNLRSAIHAMLPDSDKAGVDRYLAGVGIDPRRRAEALPADDFIRLVDELPAEWRSAIGHH